jgi:uncharacterized membrane protein YfcA
LPSSGTDLHLIIQQVKLNWNFLRLAILAILAAGIAGCGGVSGSQTVSPASFFLPGLLQTVPPPPIVATNLVASVQ